MATPLHEPDFKALFAALSDATIVLAAVSGGPDSTAMMHGLARWSGSPGRPRIIAATVDHGLRPEARLEAEAVAQIAAKLGLPHHILTWSPAAPSASQDKARRARYRLLTACAERIGADTLLTAHTLDDQAETILMRAAAGSGLTGLVGMRRRMRRGALWHVRPFLAVAKADLVATCEAEGWPFITDPSNTNPQYARPRWRRLMPQLAAEGFDARRIARLGERLGRADAALDQVAASAFAMHRTSPDSSGGWVRLDFARLVQEPAEIALRALGLAIAAVGCTSVESRLSGTGPSAIKLERLEACFASLHAAVTGARAERRTLAGRRIMLDSQGLLTISPEAPRRRGTKRVTEIAAGPPHSLGIDVMRA